MEPPPQEEQAPGTAVQVRRLRCADDVAPAVNQVEVHPYFIQPDDLEANAEHGILTQDWSPMGGITS